MADQNTQEPTMEEILASIRRIISEDEPAAPAEAESASPPHGDERDTGEPEDNILELTDRVEAPAAEPAYEAPTQTSGDLDIYERPAAARPAPAPVIDYDDEPAGDADEQPGLVSEPAAAYASTAFDQLARTVEMPASGRTLEDVVRELLRPLLKDWLDTNLPGIVETAVQAEVERISRRRFS
jgi:uncharacterized protein